MKWNRWITPLLFFAGAGLGLLAKLMDVYATNLANIFSEFSIWILFGVLISRCSRTPACAAIRVFLFYIGMLIAYYTTAAAMDLPYSRVFIIGWTVFALFSPVLGACTWYAAGGKKIISRLLSAGILLVTLLLSIVLFDGPRFYDILILIALALALFLKKGQKNGSAHQTG